MSTHTVVVQVTKEHIEKGQVMGLGQRSITCPVARAILDAVQPLFPDKKLEVAVSSRHVSVRDTSEWIHLASADLPYEVAMRIVQFDAKLSSDPGDVGEPFSFTLELHVHTLLS